MTSDADRFRFDPRRLDLTEAWPLERTKLAGTISPEDAERLAQHKAACRDDILRRNVVPRIPEAIAALRSPETAARHDLTRPALEGLVSLGRLGWTRTKLGDEVLALIDRDNA